MITSNSHKANLNDFKSLMSRTDDALNADALRRKSYYKNRDGVLLEEDVYRILSECSKGTVFEGSIKLMSGNKFPDIVACNYFGVEVKSTKGDHWTSIGNSILENTRIENVNKIYITFGKLSSPVQFVSRPYEECLSDISVTHYPRYKIDMRLQKGETIFDKIGISYDELRLMNNPVAPVSKYYRSQLKPGQTLWWVSDNVDEASPPVIKLWSSLDPKEKRLLEIEGMIYFPEIFKSSCPEKYDRFAFWLVIKKGIVNTNIRDSFSSGGKVSMETTSGEKVIMPAVFGRVRKYRTGIQKMLKETDADSLLEYWNVDIENDRIRQWCEMVSNISSSGNIYDYQKSADVLSAIFNKKVN